MNAGSPVAQHVLLIEDNPADARLLRELIGEVRDAPFALDHVGTLEEGLRCLAEENKFDLVLVDLSLPDSLGLETFARVYAAVPEMPIIVMSGLDDEDLAIKTVQEGAQDYLVKGQVDSRLLVRSMHYAIERKRVEEALAKERDLLHTLLDNLPDRIYVKDLQSRFLRISKALADLFKLKHPREAWMKSDFDFFLPGHAEEALRDEQQIIQSGQPILGKVEKETLPDGSITWALTSKLPLRDKKGNIIGSFGISRDITAIKQIEDQLQAERNVLRSLIDNLPDYIFVKDLQGRYVVDNIAHCQFLGARSPDEVVGKTVADFFPSEMAERMAQDEQAIFQNGQPMLNQEERMPDRTGRQRWHANTKVPLRNQHGNIVGLVGIGHDVTEQKQAEQQLQKAHHELQQSHEELKSAQFQLIQAEKMQSIGRLAAGVAHEVKNPLAILRMGIDYFASDVSVKDENASLILNDMKEAIKRADSIILGLLDFSVPAGLDVHPQHLGAVVEESIALVRHEMAAHRIRLHTQLGPDVPPVWIDRNKIKQVMVNVMTNAIHAMPNGGTLTVRAFSRQLRPDEIGPDVGSRLADRFRAGDTVVVLEVLDTGVGIPEETIAKVFDPFFTTKPTGKGTGLGLTVTKKIIELHGGSIDIRNQKDGGVVVTIVFKL
jgi:PAS domain S-box-containing protein